MGFPRARRRHDADGARIEEHGIDRALLVVAEDHGVRDAGCVHARAGMRPSEASSIAKATRTPGPAMPASNCRANSRVTPIWVLKSVRLASPK